MVYAIATDWSLSLTTTGVRIQARACEKVARGYAVVFNGFSRFLCHLQLASLELAYNMTEKVARNELPNQTF